MADQKSVLAALARQAAERQQNIPVQRFTVSVSVSQQLDPTQPQHLASGGRYSWDCNFTLDLQPSVLSVRVPIFPGTASAEGKINWKTAIEATWKGATFKYTDKRQNPPASRNLAVNCTVEWAQGSGQGVNALLLVRAKPAVPQRDWRTPKPLIGPGYGQTADTAVWGEGDTEGVPHEYGHLLGNPDEYDLVTFVGSPPPPPFVKKPPFTIDSIMNNPTSKNAKVHPRHYGFVAKTLLEKLGHSDTDGEITITCGGSSVKVVINRWVVLLS